MEKKSVRKYCHVNAYLAYDMDINDQNLIYKKSFKFLLGAGTNDQNMWKKLLEIFKKNGIKVELKS